MPDPALITSVPAAAVETVTTTAPEPGWKHTRTLLRLVFLLLALGFVAWALYSLEGVLLLLVFALFFAYLIAPFVGMLTRPFTVGGRERVMPRGAAIGLVYLVLFGAGGAAAAILVPLVTAQLSEFAHQAPHYLTLARDRLQTLRYITNLDQFPDPVRNAVEGTSRSALEAMASYLSGWLMAGLQLMTFVPWLVLIPVLAFFLLRDAEELRTGALMSLPHGQLRGRGADLFHDVNATLAAYIRAQLTACIIIGATCTVGFFVIGVPYALVLGLLAGVLEFIPLVGPTIVAVLATGTASFHSAGQAVATLVFLAVLRVVEDYAVYPRLIGQGIHLHPLAVILGVVCGAELAGVSGVFLAIPVMAVLSVSYRHWLEHRGSEGLVADLLKSDQVIITPEQAQAAAASTVAAAVTQPQIITTEVTAASQAPVTLRVPPPRS